MRRLPKWGHGFTDIRGKPRFYLRRRGFKKIPLPGLPWSPEFMAAYEAALAGQPSIQIGAARTKPGTIADLVARYLACPRFLSLEPLTQKSYRGVLERFRSEHGEKRVAMLQREHIHRLLARKIAQPTAANHWLRIVRALMKFAVLESMRADDPTAGVNYIKYASEGFHTWTEEDIAAFGARHPIGTKAHLAMTLMLFTGCRVGDAAALGRQHIKRGVLTYTQQKNRNRKPVTLTIPVHPELQRAIDATPANHLTFLVNSYGKPFTAKGLSDWMRDRCNEAGLPHCSAHGLRKAISRRLVEAGMSPHEVMAITGHTTLKEVERYTALRGKKFSPRRPSLDWKGNAGVANIATRLANLAPNALISLGLGAVPRFGYELPGPGSAP
jgi:site-specific recombinase XerD